MKFNLEYYYRCPSCGFPSLAVEIKDKYIIFNRDVARKLSAKRIKTSVICLTSGCKFSYKSIHGFVSHYYELLESYKKFKKKTQEQPKEVNRFEKQNTYISILNWAKKSGHSIDTSRIWELVSNKDTYEVLRRPYWKNDNESATCIMEYILNGCFQNCYITEDYLLRKN